MVSVEDSFTLLSTMSPKIDKTKGVFTKKVTKLALKTHIRRSSIYNKGSNNDNLVTVSSSSEDSNSDDVEIKTKDDKGIKNHSVIIIESSDSESNNFKLKNNFDEKNTDLKSNDDKSIDDIIKKWVRSPLKEKLFNEEVDKKIHFGDLNDLSEESIKSKEIDTCPSTPKLLDDDVKLLDELYGFGWRDSQKKLFPRTEKKKPSQKINLKSDLLCKTEIKGRKSLTYKNPYLDSEKKKSRLLALQSERRYESPLSERLKKICDSDSESERENVFVNKKLFDDSDSSDDENKFKKKNDKKNKEKIKNNPPKYQFDSFDDKNNDLKYPLLEKDKKNKPKIKKKPLKYRFDSSDDDEIKKQTKPSLTFLESLSKAVLITRCDPSARIYKENFKAHKDKLVQKLITMYNENVFEKKLGDIPIEWSERMSSSAGYCYCKKITRRNGDVERSVRIVLSVKILDSADRLRDTLIHEMCHAAAWIINQVAAGHGPLWKAWANKAMITFPELPPIKRCHAYVINTKYTYECTGCSYSFGRHSKSLDIERKRCGYCYGKFKVLINKSTKDGVKSVPVTPRGKPSPFAEFVKDNYKDVKTESLKHGDVMKILSKKFKEMKMVENNDK